MSQNGETGTFLPFKNKSENPPQRPGKFGDKMNLLSDNILESKNLKSERVKGSSSPQIRACRALRSNPKRSVCLIFPFFKERNVPFLI